MASLLIDTSVLVAIERGELRAPDVLGRDVGAVSVITVSELLHGVYRARSPVRIRRRRSAEGLLSRFEILPITDEIARLNAELGAELADQGVSIPAHDFWIGCTALHHGAGVATRNQRDFARIPGLRLVTP